MISDFNASSTESANNIPSETPLQHYGFCTEFFFFVNHLIKEGQ